MKKIRRKVGDIVKINLENGLHSYGRVITDPCIVFYDGLFNREVPVSEIVSLPILFKLFVHNSAIKDGHWVVIGSLPVSDDDLIVPYMYKQDRLTKKLYLYHSDFSDTNYEKPVTFEECKNLECAAVWDPNHVIDRLNDYHANRPNKWVEQLKIKI